MDVKNGAGKWRTHHAGLEVSWREANEGALQSKIAMPL
jgi:hypothetical protein